MEDLIYENIFQDIYLIISIVYCRAVQEGAGGEWRGDLLHHGRRVVRDLQVLQVRPLTQYLEF